MSFGFGLALPRPRPLAAVAWTPALLFASGEEGGYYDISDTSSLFQDSAGTIPVTTDGDPVGRVNDKSGNGRHLLQGTTAAKPTYKIDGSGKPYLLHDGVDDILLSATGLTLGMPVFLAAAINRLGTSTESYFSLAQDGSDHTTLGGTTGDRGRTFLRHATLGQVIAEGLGLTTGKHIISGLSVAGTTDNKIDGAAAASVANAWTTETVAGARITTGNTTAVAPTFHFYGGIALLANPGAEGRDNAAAWLAALNGVAL